MLARVSLLALFFAFTLVPTARAQPQPESRSLHEAGTRALHEIYDALRSGNVEALMERAADRIDLTIFGSSEMLSRSQAKYVVKDFFRTYPPRRLAAHETSPSDSNWFASASYFCDDPNGPLTVYLRMRASGNDRWELRELRFGRSIDR